MRIFESHAHLDFPEFDRDRDEIILRCGENGIERIINIGIDEATSLKSIELAEKYSQVFASVGYHPHEAKDYNPEIVRKLAILKKVVALGEIGLDYYRNLSPREVQRQVFADQLKTALDLSLPVIIHDRDAHEDCLEILSAYNPDRVVFHCFSGDLALAREIISRGWIVSFTGTITYKNSISAGVVRDLPLDSFFIETDCPFLSPVPRRGKRNSPLNLRYIIEKISELKRISPKEVAARTYDNAARFFNV